MHSDRTLQSARMFQNAGNFDVETMNSDASVWVPYRTYATVDVALGNMLATSWEFVFYEPITATMYFTTSFEIPP